MKASGLPGGMLALVLAAGCSAEEPIRIDQARSEKLRAVPVVSDAERKELADGNVAFALALNREVAGDGSANTVFSPASISIALAMTYAGARGETETQMAQALRFTLPQGRLHPAMNELDIALASRGAGASGADGKPFRLGVLNTVWAQQGFPLLPDYLDVLGESYGAGVNLLDFAGATESARQTINAWVGEKTEQRIRELLLQGVLKTNTKLVLTNAVYFNAAWEKPFTKPTTNGTFTRPDGSTVTVPMMRNEGTFRVAVQPAYTAIALPYQDSRLSMLVVVPAAGTLAEVETSLDAAALAQIDAGLAEQSVLLGLPRFRFETPLRLEDALSKLGMPIAFGSAADLSGINGARDLYIQAVVHKAFIAVAEKGTEAAAATAVVVGRKSAPQGLAVNVDRPFLFFVRDEPTGAILFMGRVADPS